MFGNNFGNNIDSADRNMSESETERLRRQVREAREEVFRLRGALQNHPISNFGLSTGGLFGGLG